MSHFRAEEDLLLPAFARQIQHDDPLIVRVLTDHLDLRRRALDLEADADPAPAALRELGERLKSHIRCAERVLFPKVEGTLPIEELERLGVALAHDSHATN